jgi:membrane protein YqaA with SNARE-associated domain
MAASNVSRAAVSNRRRPNDWHRRKPLPAGWTFRPMDHIPYVALALTSFVSAVFPLVSAEIAVATMAAVLPEANLLLLVAVATGAQMVGKSVMYWIGRQASSLAGRRHADAVERWGDRFRKSPASVGLLIFLSSASGLPPFYVVSTLAGAFRTSFAAFILLGTAGRFLHFTVVGLVPAAAKWMAG